MKHTARALLTLIALSACLAAHAQYQWVDANGRRVFSDQPPPPGTPQKNILKQPGPRPAAPAPAPAAQPEAAADGQDAAEAASAAPAAPAAPSAEDKALLEKKKQAEAQKEAEKQAEEQRLAQARAENCRRAISAKASLDSGRRMMTTNAQGEQRFLTPEQRGEEIKRLNEIMQRDCQ